MHKILLIYFCACILAISYVIYISYGKNTRSSAIYNAQGYSNATRTVSSCLPLFHMYPDKIKDALESPDNSTKLVHSISMFAAYRFPSYIVVTILNLPGKFVYCRYLDQEWHEVDEPLLTLVYPKYAIHCCHNPIARFMSVTTGPFDEIIDAVEILDRRPGELMYTTSLCLPPLFGNETKWLMLAEMVEHYRLQGLDHFYLYVKEIDDYSHKLLKSYEADGVAETIHLKGIIEGDEQYAEVQDCLQRSRYHSRYVVFADLDERILPTGNISLANFVREKMTKNPDVGSLWLGARWVLRTTGVPQIYEGDVTLLNHLPTLIFHNTSSISPQPASPKCIVDPTKVFWLWVHRVKYFFPNYRNLYVHESVVYIRTLDANSKSFSLSAERLRRRSYESFCCEKLNKPMGKKSFIEKETSLLATLELVTHLRIGKACRRKEKLRSAFNVLRDGIIAILLLVIGVGNGSHMLMNCVNGV